MTEDPRPFIFTLWQEGHTVDLDDVRKITMLRGQREDGATAWFIKAENRGVVTDIPLTSEAMDALARMYAVMTKSQVNLERTVQLTSKAAPMPTTVRIRKGGHWPWDYLIEVDGSIICGTNDDGLKLLRTLLAVLRPIAVDPTRFVQAVTDEIIQDVAELPDRDSPEGWPEAMIVTGEELAIIVERKVAAMLDCIGKP